MLRNASELTSLSSMCQRRICTATGTSLAGAAGQRRGQHLLRERKQRRHDEGDQRGLPAQEF